MSKFFVERTRGIGIYHLGKKRFSDFLVPLPPLDEQHEIVHRVKVLFDFADRLEVHHRNALIKVEKLTYALLDKAFSGELVTQDPNDEPVSALLERIRTEKSTQPTKFKRSVLRGRPTMPKLSKKSVNEVIDQLPTDQGYFIFKKHLIW